MSRHSLLAMLNSSTNMISVIFLLGTVSGLKQKKKEVISEISEFFLAREKKNREIFIRDGYRKKNNFSFCELITHFLQR